MNTTKSLIELPEGNKIAEYTEFSQQDKIVLADIYRKWRKLCDLLTNMNTRSINIPEILSEGAFCLATNCVRITKSISGVKTSFDCYNLNSKKRIQVKASSIKHDLTSFGPRSVWDEIYFMDFYRNGDWDGIIDIYLLDNEDVYNHKVNMVQTFKKQQEEGKRPRFSIKKSIIEMKDLQPTVQFELFR